MSILDPDLAALQEVRDAVERASRAQRVAAHWTQEETDRVCQTMAEAGARAAHDLARLAVEETGIGRVHYKVLKNLFGSQGTWDSIKDERTVGILNRGARGGVIEVGSPAGVIAAVIPTTNPTSTVLNNALIALKGRNAIVISPHPRSRRCIGETAEVLRRAIERAGGPADLVIALSNPTIESTSALMRHRKVALILATGGSGLVRSAYSSGKPAYGVGPGNVPVWIDRSADVEKAARWIVASQSFDNATLCCSEQALVLDRPIADAFLDVIQRRGAHVCTEEEARLLGRHCTRGGAMRAEVVGRDPFKIAAEAGFTVPRETTVLLAHQAGVGGEFPLSGEILCPVLSFHIEEGWERGCERSLEILNYGGLGHTIGLWATDQRVLDAWFLEKPASRIIVNGPTSQGAVGYSTGLAAAFSLGCGPHAGNITSDNITARHLISVKRVGVLTDDWEERYRSDLARAARFTGDEAPRGSGLVGDPGLRERGSSSLGDAPRPSARTAETSASHGKATLSEYASNWRGNPPSDATLVPATPSEDSSARAAPAFRRAPRFTQSGGSSAQKPMAKPGPARAIAAAHPAAPTPTPARSAGPYAGMALGPNEIQDILAHAGSGCPMGPCKGCPHHDVRTSACTA